MTTKLFAGAALACLLAGTSACSTFGGLPSGGSANGAQVLTGLSDAVKAVNSSCTGTFAANLNFAPPLPPIGNLNINQTCGLKQAGGDPSPTPAQVQAIVDAAVAKALASKP